MSRPFLARTRLPKPRFTLRSIMILIGAIALFLTLLRSVGMILLHVIPEVAKGLEAFATWETGIVLACIFFALYSIVYLMQQDERG